MTDSPFFGSPNRKCQPYPARKADWFYALLCCFLERDSSTHTHKLQYGKVPPYSILASITNDYWEGGNSGNGTYEAAFRWARSLVHLTLYCILRLPNSFPVSWAEKALFKHLQLKFFNWRCQKWNLGPSACQSVYSAFELRWTTWTEHSQSMQGEVSVLKKKASSRFSKSVALQRCEGHLYVCTGDHSNNNLGPLCSYFLILKKMSENPIIFLPLMCHLSFIV